MRLVITVLLLMVLPTALLSLLAGRSIQARELILQQQMREDAAVRLGTVAAQVDRRIDQALAAVSQTFRETVLAGSDVRRINQSRITESAPATTVKGVFLFMNPVGFIYPETAGNSGTGTVNTIVADLQPSLIRAVARDRADAKQRVAINLEGERYVFTPIENYRDLYAGIEIDGAGLHRFIKQLLDEHSTQVLRLGLLASIDQADSGAAEPENEAVVISDSLGSPTTFTIADARRRRQDAVAILSLSVLGGVEIGAFVVDGGEIVRAHALQAQLVGWGILLLVLMILGSAVALIMGAHRQVLVARRRTEFMAGMSHDLRTPVAAMRVMAESLQAGRVADENRRREFLDAIVSECDRLGDLIERIMFYFRQEQGMLRYDKRIVDVSAIAANVAARFRRQHPGRIRIEFVSAESPPPVLADADAIEKALTNLIDNAVKYGQSQRIDVDDEPETAVEITVGSEMRSEGRRDWTVLTVRDRGEGVATGEHRRIFGRFYRAYSGTHTHRGGFGLGLSMVADIVKAHNGRIRVFNAEEGGAVFEIWLRSVNGNSVKRERDSHERT